MNGADRIYIYIYTLYVRTLKIRRELLLSRTCVKVHQNRVLSIQCESLHYFGDEFLLTASRDVISLLSTRLNQPAPNLYVCIYECVRQFTTETKKVEATLTWHVIFKRISAFFRNICSTYKLSYWTSIAAHFCVEFRMCDARSSPELFSWVLLCAALKLICSLLGHLLFYFYWLVCVNMYWFTIL